MPDCIHNWFGLTYSSYLVLPRSILQSAPDEWQERFVKCLKELEELCFENHITTPDYRVTAVDENGKFIQDTYRDYDRGRIVIPLVKGE